MKSKKILGYLNMGCGVSLLTSALFLVIEGAQVDMHFLKSIMLKIAVAFLCSLDLWIIHRGIQMIKESEGSK